MRQIHQGLWPQSRSKIRPRLRRILGLQRRPVILPKLKGSCFHNAPRPWIGLMVTRRTSLGFPTREIPPRTSSKRFVASYNAMPPRLILEKGSEPRPQPRADRKAGGRVVLYHPSGIWGLSDRNQTHATHPRGNSERKPRHLEGLSRFLGHTDEPTIVGG